jgi:hypothetical protein
MTGTDYTYALEKRLEWLRWARTDGLEGYTKESKATARSVQFYIHSLANGPTYYMNDRFCELVDYARLTVQDEMEFDPAWLLSPSGWMWLQEPYLVPEMQISPLWKARKEPAWSISAVSWFPTSDGGTFFLTYLDRKLVTTNLGGFGMWSYFVLHAGERLAPRIRAFEKTAASYDEGAYVESRAAEMGHEIRWMYTALHLMSERLAVTREHTAERGTRRRWQREQVPLEPLVKIVTLRRMEEARAKDPHASAVDWQWQWHVRGFWRKQYYPSEDTHKMKWIDEYVKGPANKPFKPSTARIYAAVR